MHVFWGRGIWGVFRCRQNTTSDACVETQKMTRVLTAELGPDLAVDFHDFNVDLWFGSVLCERLQCVFVA